jgi:hypothetical protein
MAEKQLPPDAPLARRTILKGATLGVGAGLVSTLTAQAQSARNFLAAPARSRAASARRAQNQRAPGITRGSSR